MTSSKWTDVPRRLLTAAIGTPVILFMIYLNGPGSDALALILGFFSALELQAMIAREQQPVLPLLIICGAIGLAAVDAFMWAGVLALIGLGMCGVLFLLRPTALFPTVPALIIGSIYIGFPLGALVHIRALPDGVSWIYMLLVTIWVTDTAAFFGGRLFGRHKLAPKVSPGKTVEGALTGFLFGSAGGLMVCLLFGLPFGLCLGLVPVMALFTIVGDLIESVFKRYYHIKDSSHLLPGHGGFLDRLDGLFLAVIPLYCVVLLTS
ncbi:MAG: phosphatidate cytidylyltransferase [Anaerolineae bacterium]